MRHARVLVFALTIALARALPDGDEAHAAFTHACELAAQNLALVTPCPPR